MQQEKISVFWFRRDLRLDDNHGLAKALNGKFPVLPVFIFDDKIVSELEKDDARITFIYDQVNNLASELNALSGTLLCLKGSPETVWKKLLNEFDVGAVYTNADYEPYAIQRDNGIKELLAEQNIVFNQYKDQVIFEKSEIMKADQTPYTVFTPYKNKWMAAFNQKSGLERYTGNTSNLVKISRPLPSLEALGFTRSTIRVRDFKTTELKNYEEERNFPALSRTSDLSPHLRFGTVSIRKIVNQTKANQSFLNELIWREFFMQILYHFPRVMTGNFKAKYNNVQWRNDPEEFEKWKNGLTGYSIIDAGMRELNVTGYMHNRVRMIVAGFLCKHLLIDWRWGEAYFAKKLLDFELSSNNGNWQWAAGTGCDAAPYFRIFNPTEQVKKFDPDLVYIKRWVPELNSLDYPAPIVDHKMARQRAIETYKSGITQKNGN